MESLFYRFRNVSSQALHILATVTYAKACEEWPDERSWPARVHLMVLDELAFRRAGLRPRRRCTCYWCFGPFAD